MRAVPPWSTLVDLIDRLTRAEVGRLTVLAFAAATVLGAGLGCGGGSPAPDAPLARSTGPCIFGSFSNSPWNVPCARWRPYGAASPFNRRLPAAPRLDPNSANVV